MTLQRLIRETTASSLVESALVLPPLLLLFVGVVDVGRGAYAAIEVTSAAEAGALYGTLHSTDTTGMQNAAILDAGDVLNLTATGSYGCECSDGTSASPSCTSTPTCTTVVTYVRVHTQATYSPILNYPGITTPMTFNGTASMRAGY